jgi:hypothetical protein
MEQPTLVIDVWSPTNSHDDKLAKVTEYKAVPSVNYIPCINWDEPKAVFAGKTPHGHWVDANLTGHPILRRTYKTA